MNPGHQAYVDYGGRGIQLHPAWVHAFKAFYDHVGPRPSGEHSLDRVNNDGNYEPGNLRWATRAEQRANCRPLKKRGSKPEPVVHERGGNTNFRHGLIGTPEYKCWISVKSRCFNPKHTSYSDYGGRGIGVHPEWVDDFKAFYDHVGPRPSPLHSLDRYPDNDGDYEPGNVRWATIAEQNVNRRPCRTGTSHKNTTHGMTKTPEYKAWSRMHTRCFNEKSDGYSRYGACGITICSRWQTSFEEFLLDVGPRPSAKHVLARVNTDGHYACGRCPECEAKNWPRNGVWLSQLVRNQTRKAWKVAPQGSDGRFSKVNACVSIDMPL